MKTNSLLWGHGGATHPDPSFFCHVTQSFFILLSSCGYPLGFFPLLNGDVIFISLASFAVLLSSDIRLISIQHLCWHKAATSLILLFSLAKHKRGHWARLRVREGGRKWEKWWKDVQGNIKGQEVGDENDTTSHKQGIHFSWLNQRLLICYTLTFLHFT